MPSVDSTLARLGLQEGWKKDGVEGWGPRDGEGWGQSALFPRSEAPLLSCPGALILDPDEPFDRPASLRSFGHGFSRRVEGLSGFVLTHGEAVGVEMAVAASLACEAGSLPKAERDRIVALLDRFGLLPYCPECTAEAIWPLFERKFHANVPVWLPIPEGAIGRGAFLCEFSKSQLASAIDSVPQIRSRRTLTGKVEYQASVGDGAPPLRVVAEFSPSGPARFKDQESGEVRWHPSQGISPEEETYAYRLLLNRTQDPSAVFPRASRR